MIHKMAQGIQRIAEASSQVSESSNKASVEAELGNQTINKSIQQMKSINTSVNDLAQVLKQLDNRS